MGIIPPRSMAKDYLLLTFRDRGRQTETTGDLLWGVDGGLVYRHHRGDSYEYMIDAIGDKGGNHLCTHNESRMTGCTMNGEYYQYVLEDFPGQLELTWYSDWGIDKSRFSESEEALWTRHLANSSPTRPEVNLPAEFGEAFPGALRRVIRGTGLGAFATREKQRALSRGKKSPSYGDITAAFDSKYHAPPAGGLHRLRQVADDYLSYQFGAAPFIDDFRRLAQLADSFSKRKKELLNLHTNRGSRKRWDLGTGSYTLTDVRDHNISRYPVGPVMAHGTMEMTVKRWVYSTWRLNDPSTLPLTDGQLLQAMLGLDASGFVMAAWEVVPWSFLVDYFLNFGNFLEATLNTVQYSITGGICYEQTMVVSLGGGQWTTDWGQTGSISPGTVQHKNFFRNPGTPVPSLTWAANYLSGFQLSILGALTAAKSWS